MREKSRERKRSRSRGRIPIRHEPVEQDPTEPYAEEELPNFQFYGTAQEQGMGVDNISTMDKQSEAVHPQTKEGKIRVEGELIRVQYEGLPTVCFSCGKIGHTQGICPLGRQQPEGDGNEANQTKAPSGKQPMERPAETPKPEQEEAEWGEWTNVPTRARRGPKKPLEGPLVINTHGPTKHMGSRFSALAGNSEDTLGNVQEGGPSTRNPGTQNMRETTKTTQNKTQNVTILSEADHQLIVISDTPPNQKTSTHSPTQTIQPPIRMNFFPRTTHTVHPHEPPDFPNHEAHDGHPLKNFGSKSSEMKEDPPPCLDTPMIEAARGSEISGLKASRKIRKLDFPNSHRVDARSFAGGIWVLWNVGFLNVKIVACHTQFIHLQVRVENSYVFVTAIYGSPQEKWRRFLWQNIEALAKAVKGPWVLIEDFNAILDGLERQDGLGRNGVADKQFMDCIFRAELQDLGFEGSKFTWKRGDKYARLDRVLSNEQGFLQFPTASVKHLPRICSDHNPVLLQLMGAPARHSNTKQFRFFAAWLLHEEFDTLVQDGWNADLTLPDALPCFMEKAQIWNRTVFVNIHRRKRNLLARIGGIQKYLETKPSNFLTKLEMELRLELDTVLMQEELLWAQKAKCKWIQAGDKNTSYFHTTVAGRRRRSRITELQDDQEEEIPCTVKELNGSSLCKIWPDFLQSLGWSVANGRRVKFWKDMWLDQHGNLLERTIHQVPHDMQDLYVEDLVTDSGDWDWENITPYLDESEWRKFWVVLPPSERRGEDRMRWLLE
ncbi:hypothetical protein Tsubulata_023151 [Turnera subulata]|uniref:CCHC-type domain-containing protein n=1 Tax=Turnera subulata TaxID=218843 RepID=A0A9Q0FWW5_9ROSI|nr:hypothetical protein Tsubulata_023151 [Turnera subulata]